MQLSCINCCYRFLESVDEQVSDLRKGLEGRQSVGHAPDLVDRSVASAFNELLFSCVCVLV